MFLNMKLSCHIFFYLSRVIIEMSLEDKGGGKSVGEGFSFPKGSFGLDHLLLDFLGGEGFVDKDNRKRGFFTKEMGKFFSTLGCFVFGETNNNFFDFFSSACFLDFLNRLGGVFDS